jgi:glycopeptide antibiotics resistance protein
MTQRDHLRVLALAIVLIAALMLAPSPREWGAWGKWLSPGYDLVSPVLQPLAHVACMTVMSLLIMRYLVRYSIAHAVLIGGSVSMLLALLLEFAQLAIPENFSRTFDLSDLAFALLGVVIGCLIGARIHRNEHGNQT